MEQLELKIAVGGETSSQPRAHVAEKPPRRVQPPPIESPQLKFRLLVLQPTRLPVIDRRPSTTDECDARHTWLPYCPHVQCQYHLLVDIADEHGALRSPFVSEDGEFLLDEIPRIAETFSVDLLDPEDRPSGVDANGTITARVPATCALRVAKMLEREHGDQIVEYSAIGEFLKLSKERVRQIANDAYEKGRRARESLLGEGQTIGDLFDG